MDIEIKILTIPNFFFYMSSFFSFGNFVERAKEVYNFLISAMITNILSVIFNPKCSAKSGNLLAKKQLWINQRSITTLISLLIYTQFFVIASSFFTYKLNVLNQMGAIEKKFKNVPNIFYVSGAKGLLGDFVEKIPKIKMTSNNKVDASREKVSCLVCFQVWSFFSYYFFFVFPIISFLSGR